MAGYLFKWLSAASLCFILAGQDGGRGETHPLYITVTDIKHNPKDKILEISCKIFTNDFESVLEKMARRHVDLSAAADKAASGRLISDYVVKHLRLKIDGNSVVLHFIGSENENDGTWSYFQVNDVPSVRRIDVVDELLYDGFSQQINILQVTVGGERKSTKLDCPAASAIFEF